MGSAGARVSSYPPLNYVGMEKTTSKMMSALALEFARINEHVDSQNDVEVQKRIDALRERAQTDLPAAAPYLILVGENKKKGLSWSMSANRATEAITEILKANTSTEERTEALFASVHPALTKSETVYEWFFGCLEHPLAYGAFSLHDIMTKGKKIFDTVMEEKTWLIYVLTNEITHCRSKHVPTARGAKRVSPVADANQCMICETPTKGIRFTFREETKPRALSSKETKDEKLDMVAVRYLVCAAASICDRRKCREKAHTYIWSIHSAAENAVPVLWKHQCEYCCRYDLAEISTLKRCGRCRHSRYCNLECQTRDWPLHKLLCSPRHSSTCS